MQFSWRGCAALLARVAVGSLLVGCGGDDEDGPGPTESKQDPPEPLPALGAAPLTTERTIVATHAVVAAPTQTPNPQVPEDLATFLGDGFGAFEYGGALIPVAHTLDDSAPPEPAGAPTLLSRFVHLADTQLADDESPTRLANFDSAGGLTSAAFRPQEGHECRILQAAVRTINRVHQDTPIGFVVLGGDNADSAQENELDWFNAVLDGADSVHCDSGADDDPVPGANNDPKDPFLAEGLDVPWKWVTGNHDILVQGNLPVDGFFEASVGSVVNGGTRNWALPGAPVVSEEVPADERRKVMTRTEMVARVQASGDGHGIDDAVLSSGKAQYTFDVEGTPIRWIVLDTAAETGGSEGVVRQGDIDGFLVPALDAAQAEGKWVILTSHHASQLLGDGTGLGGTAQPDAVTTDAFRAVVAGYDNVLMHLAGHTHTHRVKVATSDTGKPYWEVETSALVDWPQEIRVFEIWDHGEGLVSIHGVPIDFATDDDPIAAEGRTLGILDYTTGWQGDGAGDPADRAVVLWAQMP
jgi:3',5'-cyclic AMP phosphodiesterase CpdA